MTVDWSTLTQTKSGWQVQDINGEDWFAIKEYLGIENPGQLISQLCIEREQLIRTVGLLRDQIKDEVNPLLHALRHAELALVRPYTQTQP